MNAFAIMLISVIAVFAVGFGIEITAIKNRLDELEEKGHVEDCQNRKDA